MIIEAGSNFCYFVQPRDNVLIIIIYIMGDDLRFVSSAYLLASHDFLNQKCQSASDAFMRCKAKDQDPAACYKIGNELSACGAKMYE